MGWTSRPIAASDTSGEDRINDLLTADNPSSTATATEEADAAAGDTPVAGSDIATEEEVEQPEEAEAETETEADDAEATEGDETDEEEAGDDDFPEENLETDYSETTYANAARHWQKRGVDLDPNKPEHRALLKEFLDRGQKIRELSTRQEEAPEEEEAAETAEAAAAETKTPEQWMSETWESSKKYAEETFNPQMSRDAIVPLLAAMANVFWPGKGHDKALLEAGRISDNDVKAISLAIRPAIAMELAMSLPSIFQGVPQAVSSAYPYIGDMHTMAMKERVVDELIGATTEDGQPRYPGLDTLIESDKIREIMNGPEFKDEKGKELVFNRDPYKNLVHRVKMAYRIASSGRASSQQLERATRRGKEAEQARQRRVAAGRTPPGRSGAGTVPGGTEGGLKGRILGESGSRFSRLVNSSRE